MPATSQESMPLGKQQNTARISAHGWVMIILLLSLGVINFGDKAVLGLAAVPIINEFHLSPTQYGLVSGSLFWLFAFSSVLMTAWSDRIGTKKVLSLLAAIWALVQFATLFVFTFPALLLTRVVLGAGEGPAYGTSVSAAIPWLPNSRRGFGLALITLGSVVGPAVLTPPLAFLIFSVGWRAAFAFLGGLGILWVILWLLLGREQPEAKDILTDTMPKDRARIRWSQVLPVIFSPTVLFAALAAFALYWASALYLNWNPVYLTTVRHLSSNNPLYIAGITLPYIVGGITLIAFGMLADHIFRQTESYRRAYVYLVAASLLITALCLYLAVNNPSPLGTVIFLSLAPVGTAIPMLSTIVTAVAPVTYRGTVLGIVVAVSTLSGIIASLVTGLIIQAAGKNAASGFHNAYQFASLLLLIIAVAFLAFARPDDHLLEEKTTQ